MKRSAFTLVELIFVIVIIGVLAAVAIPQYKNLKQNAEAKAVIKTTMDAAQSAANAAVNQMDLENNSSITLADLVTVNGKGWTSEGNTTSYKTTEGTVAEITLSGRTVSYGISCSKFLDSTTETKCYDTLGITSGNDYNKTINF